MICNTAHQNCNIGLKQEAVLFIMIVRQALLLPWIIYSNRIITKSKQGRKIWCLREFSWVGSSPSQLLNAFCEMLTPECFCWNFSNTAKNQLNFVIWIKNLQESIFKNFGPIVWRLVQQFHLYGRTQCISFFLFLFL